VVITIDRQTGQVVAGPDIVTKGFVPEEDATDIVDRTRQKILDGLADTQRGEHLAEVATIRDTIHDTVSAYLYERTKRRPMVLPVIMQV
jgi:ribonuclease J